MQETETPRTDAATFDADALLDGVCFTKNVKNGLLVMAEFARQLERELAAALLKEPEEK